MFLIFRKLFLTENLRKLSLTENLSNETLSLISKWVEYVSLIFFFKLQGTIMNLGNKLTLS